MMTSRFINRVDKLLNGYPPDIGSMFSWFFDHPVFCLKSKFTAKLGSDLDYAYFTTNVPAELVKPVSERVKVLTATAYKKHTWRMQDIPPFVPDTMAFFDDEAQRSGLHFQLISIYGQKRVLSGSFGDEHWQHIGESFQGYLHEYVKKTKSMKKLARKLASDLEGAQAKVETIYDYVSDEYEIDSTEFFRGV